MTLNKKTIITSIIVFPVLPIIVVFACIYRPPVNLLENSSYTFTVFTDSSDHLQEGRSVCKLSKTSDGMQILTDLNEGYKFPYAGITVFPKDEKPTDLRNYNINLTLTSKQEFRLPVRLTVYIPGFTKKEVPTSYLFLIETLPVMQGTGSYIMPISSFDEIPQWWFTENAISEKDLHDYSLKNAQGISFFSDPSYPLDKNIEYTLNELTLTFDFKPFVFFSVLLLLLYYIVIALLWKFSTLKKKLIVVPIEATKVNNHTVDHQSLILAFIGSNYNNADLKIKDVAVHVGVSEGQVSEILKNYCKMGFKQYLNQVRLEEAKRLLKHSDLQVSEIAFKVGYNNVTHFNRTFKEVEQISPSLFRDK